MSKGNIRSKFGLVADYDFLDQSVDSRLKNDLETIDMTFSYNFLDDFYLNAGGRYDLTSDIFAKPPMELACILDFGNMVLYRNI